MKRGPILFLLFVLITVLVVVACWVEVNRRLYDTATIMGVIFTFVTAQMNLLSIWTVLGSGFWLWRVVTLVAGITTWAWFIAWTTYLPFAKIESTFVIQVGIVMAASGWLSLAGFRWIDVIGVHANNRHHEKRQPFQFSIGDVLRLMVLAAILLLAARVADLSLGEAMSAAVICLADTLLAMLAVWAILPLRWWTSRFLVYVVATAAIGLVLSFLESDATIVSFFSLQALFLLAWLGVCRLAGYRVVRIYQRSEA